MIKKTFRFLRLQYLLIFIVFLMIEVAERWELLPAHTMTDAQVIYGADVFCILITLVAVYFGIQLLERKKVKNLLQKGEETEQLAVYRHYATVRTLILGGALLLNRVEDFLLAATNTAEFAVKIMAIVLLFFWPRKKEFMRLTNRE